MRCLAYLLDRFDTCRGDNLDAWQTAHWAAQSILIGFHADEARFKQDIAAIREWETPPLEEFRKNLRRQSVKAELSREYNRLGDMDEPISRSDTLFSFVYALLRWKGALSFPSMRPIQADRVRDSSDENGDEVESKIAARNVLHEHHIYPASRLQKELEVADDGWLDKRWINDIGNITFILGEDNFGINNSAIEYLDDIDSTVRVPHMIGTGRYRTGEYKSFLTDRRRMVKKALKDYFGDLEERAGT
jgi:hypothetical protein